MRMRHTTLVIDIKGFLQILKNRVQRGNGIIIASIIEQTLAPRELALIEREMQLFGR